MMKPGHTTISVQLDAEQLAMLDAIRTKPRLGRAPMVKSILLAVLEDDAAAHGAFTSPEGKVVILRDWRRADATL